MSIFCSNFVNSCLKIGLLRQDCLLCGAQCESLSLCPACLKRLPYLAFSRCPCCAQPTLDASVCGACLARPPFFHSTLAAFSYSFPVDAMIQSLKYGSRLPVAATLAELLLGEIATTNHAKPDCLIPMPLGAARLKQRGFNQALEIARRVSRKTGIALLPEGCQRIRETLPQTSLPWKERARNIRGAFACSLDLQGKRIAIVDDVMTTGATMNEVAKVLRRQGAAEVSAWVVARTLQKGDG